MKLIIGNWKMNPGTLDEAVELARQSDFQGLVICPPYVYLEPISKVVLKAKLGAQDVFFENPAGPYTGEVSISELKDLGISYVIVGHSERRELGETDEIIAKKIKAALEENITPVLCVGEKKEDRNAGREKEVVKKQLEIDLFFADKINNNQELVVAYEPIWAISKGNTKHQPAGPGDAIEMINFIKETLQLLSIKRPVKIIYGGSVNGKNAADFLKHDEIQGALPGGASLKPEEIGKIIEAAGRY